MLGEALAILSLFCPTYKSEFPFPFILRTTHLVSCPFVFWSHCLFFPLELTFVGSTKVVAHWGLSGLLWPGGCWERRMAWTSGGKLGALLPHWWARRWTQVNGWTFSCFGVLSITTMRMDFMFFKDLSNLKMPNLSRKPALGASLWSLLVHTPVEQVPGSSWHPQCSLSAGFGGVCSTACRMWCSPV